MKSLAHCQWLFIVLLKRLAIDFLIKAVNNYTVVFVIIFDVGIYLRHLCKRNFLEHAKFFPTIEA
jgi:hypothetical protein